MDEENLVINEYLRQVLCKFSRKVCLQIKKDTQWERWTYEQLGEQILRIAGFLVKKGFKKGDFASIILENSPEWPAIYLGILQAGLTCVPLDPQLSSEEIKNLILDSGAKIVFTSREIFFQKLRQIDTEVVVLETDIEKIKNTSYENINWPKINSYDIASLIYTSGTTGKPKGVMLSHKNICANLISIQKMNLCFSTDNFLSILPLHHSYPFMVSLLVPLFTGAKITYCQSLKAEEFIQIIQETAVTVLIGVPQLFIFLHKAIFDRIKKIPFLLRPAILPFVRMRLKHKFGSLRLLVSGGARLEPKIAKDLNRLGLRLIEGYGLTEASPVVSLNPPQRIKFGSVGRAIPDVEIKILNPDRKGIGEVLIKGPNVMEGYFKQPQLTAQTIKDGWLYTGDLGYIDREGYLYLVGRKKEVIVLSSGKNIYPEELEEYYLQSPYIKEICILHRQEKVFGYFKDSLFAVIVPDLEYFRQKKEANIYEKVRWDLETLGKRLAPYQHIMGFILTKDPLPRTALRKIKRSEVMQRYLIKEKKQIQKEILLTDEDKQILDKEFTQKLIHYIAKEFNRQVDINSHLEIDLGIDSLTRVELGLALEAFLKIKIPDEVISRIATVKELVINLEKLIEDKRVISERVEEKTWKEILRELPAEEIIKKIKIDFGLYEKMVSWLVKNILLFIFRLIWFLRVEGSGNLPREGPYLICPNHASYLDGLFIFLSIPFKTSLLTYFLGYQRIFEYPLLVWTNRLCRMISIDPNFRLTQAMQAVGYVLAHKRIVCIFPEGMRSIDGEVKEFKKGVGILLKELDIPVVPVYIEGSHYSWPRGSKFPRPHPIRVIFGRALSVKELGDNYEMIAQRLREEVLKLIPQK